MQFKFLCKLGGKVEKLLLCKFARLTLMNQWLKLRKPKRTELVRVKRYFY